MRFPTRVLSLVVVLSLSVACGGTDGSGASGDEAVEASGPWPAQPTGSVDERLAERGERLFREKGCVSCHKIGGGRLVGPDLEGITERRSYAWTMGMITSPDSMLRSDTIAERLLGEYFTPMSDQGVTPEESRAIWEHLRHEDEEAGAGAGER